MLPLVVGSTLLIYDISDIKNIELMAEKLFRWKVSHIYSVPLIFYLLSKAPYIEQIGRQAYILMSGGYKLPASLRKRFEQKLKTPIFEGYGLSEASPVCTCQSRGKQFDSASIGPAMAHYQIKIMDETGTEVPRGEKGEIWFYGDNIMKGYFNRPEATGKKIVDGWLRTGDYGKQDRPAMYFSWVLKKDVQCCRQQGIS